MACLQLISVDVSLATMSIVTRAVRYAVLRPDFRHRGINGILSITACAVSWPRFTSTTCAFSSSRVMRTTSTLCYERMFPTFSQSPAGTSHARLCHSSSKRKLSEPTDASHENSRASSTPPPPVVLNEEDIVETFTKGGGPGGQKVNKTASCVMLRHKPTGIIVKCQDSRSQYRNREIARRILLEKLDHAIRGEFSRMAQEAAKERARKAVRRRKCIKKHFKSKRDRALL